MISLVDKKYIFQTLQSLYPDSTTELFYETPFQLLIAVLMSAQTTDKQVNKVTLHLRTHIRQPSDVLKMGLPDLTNKISAINYYRTKAKHIYRTSQLLLDTKAPLGIPFSPQKLKDLTLLTPQIVYQKYGYWLGDSVDELILFPGVGVKTAKVVLHVLYGHEVIAVDTHVHRVSNRLGLVATRSPQDTAKIIESVVPAEYLGIAHHAMILFGRYHCKAINPLCEDCLLQSVCLRYRTIEKS